MAKEQIRKASDDEVLGEIEMNTVEVVIAADEDDSDDVVIDEDTGTADERVLSSSSMAKHRENSDGSFSLVLTDYLDVDEVLSMNKKPTAEDFDPNYVAE